MFGQPFYHHTLRKIVASFGAIFADIFVIKRDAVGQEIERIKVPLAYGPAERYLVRNAEDPDLSRTYAIKLPRMSFEIKSVEYDSQRKLNTIKRNISEIDETQGQVFRQYQGVPYRIGVELSVLSKYMDDANQIIEQILPWFTPAFTITVNSIPGMKYKDDVPITLSSVSLQDNYEDDWKVRRDIIWTLTFDIKAIFYGPIVERDVITRAIADVYAATFVDLKDQPGLNGLSPGGRGVVEVSPENATFADPFNYIESVEGSLFGERLNPKTGLVEPAVNRVQPEPIEPKLKVRPPQLK